MTPDRREAQRRYDAREPDDGPRYEPIEIACPACESSETSQGCPVCRGTGRRMTYRDRRVTT